MGWWSKTVMGGDTPLDCQAEILFDICNVDEDLYYDSEDDNEVTDHVRSQLMKHITDIVNSTAKFDDLYYEHGGQVIGVLIMQYGVPKSDEVNELIRWAIKCTENDEWAHEDEERKAYMVDFIEKLKRYNGKPTDIAHEGLLEVIVKADAEGKTGLVNISKP